MHQTSFMIIAVAALLGVAAVLPAQRRAPHPVGETYPDLVLPSLKDGKPLALSSFRGKKVMLIEFASW